MYLEGLQSYLKTPIRLYFDLGEKGCSCNFNIYQALLNVHVILRLFFNFIQIKCFCNSCEPVKDNLMSSWVTFATEKSNIDMFLFSALKIHVSSETKQVLDKFNTFELERRSPDIEVKVSQSLLIINEKYSQSTLQTLLL